MPGPSNFLPHHDVIFSGWECASCFQWKKRDSYYEDGASHCKACKRTLQKIHRYARQQNKSAALKFFLKGAPKQERLALLQRAESHPVVRRKAGKPPPPPFDFSPWITSVTRG